MNASLKGQALPELCGVGTDSFELEAKRLYLPGLEMTATCPKCPAVVRQNFADSYVSYPKMNEPTPVYLCCPECEHEWEEKIVLRLVVEVVRGAAPRPRQSTPRAGRGSTRPRS